MTSEKIREPSHSPKRHIIGSSKVIGVMNRSDRAPYQEPETAALPSLGSLRRVILRFSGSSSSQGSPGTKPRHFCGASLFIR